jgi:hypothetical protein
MTGTERRSPVGAEDETAAVAAVIEDYVAAARAGDATLMGSIFHPTAHMYGRAGKHLFADPIAGFVAHVGEGPSPESRDEAYAARIADIAVSGDLALVTLEETAYQGRDYLDRFVLLKTLQGWQIVTKGFAVVR